MNPLSYFRFKKFLFAGQSLVLHCMVTPVEIECPDEGFEIHWQGQSLCHTPAKQTLPYSYPIGIGEFFAILVKNVGDQARYINLTVYVKAVTYHGEDLGHHIDERVSEQGGAVDPKPFV